MKYLDTRVRVMHPCPFCEISRRHPDVDFALWCSETNVVLQTSAKDESALKVFLEDAKASLGFKNTVKTGSSALVMMPPTVCQTYRTVSQVATRYKCWLVPPETYHEGWETHRVISPGKEALKAFVAEVNKMGRAEIVSHISRDQVSILIDLTVAVHFFEGLTPKQIKCLVLAYENGLFEVPARTGLDTLAKQAQLSRSTFGEHLRKAQLQILRNSYPLLKLRSLEPLSESEGQCGRRKERG